SHHTSIHVICTLSLHDALPIYLPYLLHLLASNFRQDVYTFCTNVDKQYHSNSRFHLTYHQIILLIYSDYAVLTFSLSQAKTGSLDRKSTRLNSSHVSISYPVFC